MKTVAKIFFTITCLYACNSGEINRVSESTDVHYAIPNDTLEIHAEGLTKNAGYQLYRNEPFSGYLQTAFPSGKIKKIVPYHEGKIQGEVLGFYSDGSKSMIRRYHLGKKVDTHQLWWSNGNTKMEATYEDDEYHGYLKEWYPDGRPYKFFHYAMGREEGSQRMWEADGSFRANYVVKNGKTYGLTGRKRCVSVMN